jgi:hypothetical protein
MRCPAAGAVVSCRARAKAEPRKGAQGITRQGFEHSSLDVAHSSPNSPSNGALKPPLAPELGRDTGVGALLDQAEQVEDFSSLL